MNRQRRDSLLITAGALFALFFPTSIQGIISPGLDRLAILLNVALFTALILRGYIGDRLQVVTALSLVGWLSLVTLLTPQYEFSPGVFFIFVGLALLLGTDVRRVRGRHSTAMLLAVNLFVLVVGLGLSLNVEAANTFIKTYYSAYYPTLLTSMIDWYHKPVLTFATHSTAGFFYYLFFWLNFRTFRSTGRPVWLAWTLVTLGLGLNVRSTTSLVLMALACVQLSLYLGARLRRPVRWAFVTVAPVLALIVVLSWGGARDTLEAASDLIAGNRTRGLTARYAQTGLLAGNLRYLSESPFRPIGFNYGPESLFYGDSGYVLVLLRGSLPLLVIVYGGYARFLRRNLIETRDAVCLLIVTAAFAVGYTPLQLFRFTAFLPFVIAYLNALEPEADPGRR